MCCAMGILGCVEESIPAQGRAAKGLLHLPLPHQLPAARDQAPWLCLKPCPFTSQCTVLGVGAGLWESALLASGPSSALPCHVAVGKPSAGHNAFPWPMVRVG